jgi:hypothetical protein
LEYFLFERENMNILLWNVRFVEGATLPYLSRRFRCLQRERMNVLLGNIRFGVDRRPIVPAGNIMFSSGT